jgi:hypothetical protein
MKREARSVISDSESGTSQDLILIAAVDQPNEFIDLITHIPL